jgi:hypothetical protein
MTPSVHPVAARPDQGVPEQPQQGGATIDDPGHTGGEAPTGGGGVAAVPPAPSQLCLPNALSQIHMWWQTFSAELLGHMVRMELQINELREAMTVVQRESGTTRESLAHNVTRINSRLDSQLRSLELMSMAMLGQRRAERDDRSRSPPPRAAPHGG